MANAEIARAYLDAVVAQDYERLETLFCGRFPAARPEAIDELCTGFFAP